MKLLHSEKAELQRNVKTFKEDIKNKDELLTQVKEQVKKEHNNVLYLSEQLRMLTESTKDSILNILQEKNKINKDKLFQLQFELQSTQQKLIQTRDSFNDLLHKVEAHNKDFIHLSVILEEYKERNKVLENQLKEVQEQYELNKDRELCILKEEMKKLEQSINQLKYENNKLIEENAALVGHTNSNQKIQILKKIKEENNNLRSENYHLKENIRTLTYKLNQQVILTKEPQSKYSALTGNKRA